MTINVEIPSDYESITIKQYKDFHLASSELERIMAICSVTKEEAEKIPIRHYGELIAVFAEGLRKESAKHFQTITLNGREYGFMPNLYDISVGEYIDLTEYAKDIKKNIVKIAGILYRPITIRVNKQYQIEPYSIKANELRENELSSMTLEVFNGAMLFFSTLHDELHSISSDFLSQQIKEIMELTNKSAE